MHYYPFNIGNYRRDTHHLSLLEHGIYRQLLDTYYLTEEPLCSDYAKLMRTHCICTKEEEKALENILKDFFLLTDNGYLHKGCEKIIAEYATKTEKAKIAAEKRWQKHADAMRTHTERNAHQTPDTIHQTPIKNTRDKPLSCPDGVTIEVWDGFLKVRKAKKAPVTEAALAGIQREARKAGWSLNAALTECCARGWAGFKADWVKTDAEKKMSPYQASVRAAGIAIFGNLEEPQHEQHSTIDITPGTQAPAGLLGSEDL